MDDFGRKLKAARENCSMTQQELADRLFVTRQTVSRWECSERYPDIITLGKLTAILGISADELLSARFPENAVTQAPGQGSEAQSDGQVTVGKKLICGVVASYIVSLLIVTAGAIRIIRLKK